MHHKQFTVDGPGFNFGAETNRQQFSFPAVQPVQPRDNSLGPERKIFQQCNLVVVVSCLLKVSKREQDHLLQTG